MNEDLTLNDIRTSYDTGQLLQTTNIFRNDLKAVGDFSKMDSKPESKASDIGFLLNEDSTHTPPRIVLKPSSLSSSSRRLLVRQVHGGPEQLKDAKHDCFDTSQFVVSDEMLDICISHIASEMASRICKRVESSLPGYTPEVLSETPSRNQKEHGIVAEMISMAAEKIPDTPLDACSPTMKKERLISLQALCSSPRLNLAEQFDQNSTVQSESL
jgi:hypothetical protein